MTYPLDRPSLIARVEAGDTFDYYFFYGHKQKSEAVDAACLSQWFPVLVRNRRADLPHRRTLDDG